MRFSVNISILENLKDAVYYYEGRNTQTIISLAELGFSVLDFSFAPYANRNTTPQNSALARDDWRDWIKEMRRIGDAEGIIFGQGHGIHNLFFDDGNPMVVHPYAQELENRIFEACCLLRIPHIVYHPVTPAIFAAQKDVKACKEHNVSYLSASARKAASFGLSLAIENMVDYSVKKPHGQWTYAADPDELADLVDTINMPNVFVCLDTGHANIQHRGVYDAVDVLGTRIGALHVHDNMGQEDQHLPPFYGSVEWELVLQKLACIEYKGDFTYEVGARRLPFTLRTTAVKHFREIGLWLVKRYEELQNAQVNNMDCMRS